MDFSKNLLNYRKLKGYTQEDLAEKLQVSRQSISKWENGEAFPDLPKTIKIAKTLDTSLDELCGIETNSKIETNQNIKAEQDINLKFKPHPFLSFVCSLLIALIFGICGYHIGCSTISQTTLDDINVTNLNFSMTNGSLVCRFVPDLYSEEYEYTVMLIDHTLGTQKSVKANFENGIGSATITPYYDHYQVVLQISDETHTKSIVLEDHLYLNRDQNTTRTE